MQNLLVNIKFQTLRSVRILAALVLLFTISLISPLKAQSDGPTSAIAEGIGKLLEGITNINIQSTTLGIDKGLIAGAILGIGRTVERNPFPTGKHDQYLVKDRMRLGYELGAGFVVAGTVSYVQEWTLVYPVETSLKGTLSRKFLVDLFLPIRVKKWQTDNLPKDFALIRESFIEGKGRLKFGGHVPFMVGNQISYGKVQLESIMTRKYRNGELKVIRELSSFYRLAYELWANLALFDLPLFEAYRHKGEVVRHYLDINNKNYPPSGRHKLLEVLFTGQNITKLQAAFEDEKLTRKVHSAFNERYSSITFFGIFNKDSFTREDYVTDTTYDQDGNEEVNFWWQNLDRHYHDWTTGLRSELYRSDVHYSGLPILNAQNQVTAIEKPQMRLKLTVKDDETSLSEYKDDYLTLLKELNIERPASWPDIRDWNSLLSEKMPFFGDKNKTPETLFSLEIHLDEHHLENLQNTTLNQWYRALEKETGKSRAFWQRAAEEGYYSRNRRRLRQTRPLLNEAHMAKKVIAIGRFLERSRKLQASEPLLAQRYLNWAVRRMFDVGSGQKNTSWDIRLLKVLTKLLDSPPWVGAQLQVYLEGEDKVDHRLQLKYSSGESPWEDRPEYNFILKDPAEIYYLFEEDKTF